MHPTAVVYLVLALAGVPFVYYVIALYSSWRFFSSGKAEPVTGFAPPVSILKPVRGADPDAYENFASFCKQDYPDYEILFCVDPDDSAVPTLQKLIRDFPKTQIRLLFGSGRDAINDKVARLVRLTNEAKHDIFVISDSDVRVRPDYLRSVVAPFRNPKLGAATCLYASTKEVTFLDALQSISMISDFFANVLIAWELEGIKFTFGQSIITTRKNIEGFGGYQILENRPADDFYIGRLAAEQGLETKLLPYVVQSVADFQSLRDLLYKRVRWATVQRHMRPLGHVGLVFTWGLPWALTALAVHPSAHAGAVYLGGYLLFRIAMAWLIGSWGMKQTGVWKKMLLIPVWDVLAFAIWVVSFARNTIRWRGVDYLLQEGMLVAASPSAR